MFAVEMTSCSADVGGVEWAFWVIGKVLDVYYQGLDLGVTEGYCGRYGVEESGEEARNIDFERGVGAGVAPVSGVQEAELIVYQEETRCGVAGDRSRHLESGVRKQICSHGSRYLANCIQGVEGQMQVPFEFVSNHSQGRAATNSFTS